MDEQYDFIRMSEDKLEDFAFLAKDAHGVEPTKEDAKALFDTSAWGKEYIGYMAYHRETGEPAAFYGIFPCFVEYNGKRYLAAQSGSTMTHSEHRMKGLFFKTAQMTFDLARKEGIEFVFGFPNPSSYRGFIKLGWSHDYNFNSYHIFVPTLPFGFFANKFRFLLPLYRSWFKLVVNRWRVKDYPFPNSSDGPDIGFVSRDEHSMAYKRESDDRMILRSGENAVWINQQGGAIGLGDVELADGDKDFKKVMRFLKFICFLSGSFHLRTYVSPGCKLDSFFRNGGYRPRSDVPICFLDLTGELPVEKFKFVYGDFDTF